MLSGMLADELETGCTACVAPACSRRFCAIMSPCCRRLHPPRCVQTTTTTVELCNALGHSIDWSKNCPNQLTKPALQLVNQDSVLYRAASKPCGKPVCDGTSACADCRCPTGTVSTWCQHDKQQHCGHWHGGLGMELLAGSAKAGASIPSIPKRWLRASQVVTAPPRSLCPFPHHLCSQCDALTKQCPCDGITLVDCTKCKCPNGQVRGAM